MLLEQRHAAVGAGLPIARHASQVTDHVATMSQPPSIVRRLRVRAFRRRPEGISAVPRRDAATEAAPYEWERSFRLLFTTNPLPMWVHDARTLAVLEVNDAALALYGYSREEFLHLRLTDLYSPGASVPDGVKERPEPPRGSVTEHEGVWQQHTRDGRPITVEVSTRSIELAGCPSVLIVGREMTASRHERECSACHVAKRLARLRDDFVEAINHELRTPLTAIMGYTELLGERWDALSDSHRREHVARIRGAADRLQHLVDDLVLARLDCASLHRRRQSLSLAAAVQQAVTVVRSRYPDHGIIVPGDDNLRVWGDAEWLGRIFVHLLDNAVKYSVEGRPVVVSWEADGERAVLRVRDQGLGIPEQDRELLFTCFGRNAGRVRAGRVGTGLGLYLGRHLAEALDGDLNLEATGPTGSTFRLRIPRVMPQAESSRGT